MTLIIGFLFLAIPLPDLFTQPICPFVNALTRSCGDGDYLNVRVEFGYIALAGFEVIKTWLRDHENMALIPSEYRIFELK